MLVSLILAHPVCVIGNVRITVSVRTNVCYAHGCYLTGYCNNTFEQLSLVIVNISVLYEHRVNYTMEVTSALSHGDISNDLDATLTRFPRSRHF